MTGVGFDRSPVPRPSLVRRSPCLLARAKDDPDAFAAFYDAYAERVLVYFARRVLDVDVAFDLLSETFAKALEHRAQFRGASPEQEQGWLFSIAPSAYQRFQLRENGSAWPFDWCARPSPTILVCQPNGNSTDAGTT